MFYTMGVLGSILCMPEELRPLLASRAPCSMLVPSLNYVESMLRYARLIVVGDRVTRDALSLGLRPVLAVYDCTEMRYNVECPELPRYYRRVQVANPRSSVSLEALNAIRDGIRSGRYTAIQVKGEEDLLAIPAILYADVGSIVVYGQPSRGVPLVHVDWYVKRLAWSLLRMFQPCDVPLEKAKE